MNPDAVFFTATVAEIVSQCQAAVKFVLEWAANRGSRCVGRSHVCCCTETMVSQFGMNFNDATFVLTLYCEMPCQLSCAQRAVLIVLRGLFHNFPSFCDGVAVFGDRNEKAKQGCCLPTKL